MTSATAPFEPYAPTGQVGFLASQRVDGKLILPEAVQVLHAAGVIDWGAIPLG